MNVTLAGLPELDLFPTQQAREKALREIATEAGTPTRLSFWIGVAILVVAVLGSFTAGRWLLRFVSWPRLVEEFAPLIAGGFMFLATLRWLHRSGAAVELRHKLLAAGVPVCTKCGYLLRGLPQCARRCPECGAAIDLARIESMRDASDKTGD